VSLGGSSAAVSQTAGSLEHDAAAPADAAATTGTVLALDFGLRRIGVAIGDTQLRIAHPLQTIRAEDNRRRFAAIALLVAEWRPTRFVLGYPESGSDAALVTALERFERRLVARFGLPVERVDETLSSWEASRQLSAAGRPARAQKEHLDAMAACVILQSWFERCPMRPSNAEHST
jgi:putative holliday junction resolvase